MEFSPTSLESSCLSSSTVPLKYTVPFSPILMKFPHADLEVQAQGEILQARGLLKERRYLSPCPVESFSCSNESIWTCTFLISGAYQSVSMSADLAWEGIKDVCASPANPTASWAQSIPPSPPWLPPKVTLLPCPSISYCRGYLLWYVSSPKLAL